MSIDVSFTDLYRRSRYCKVEEETKRTAQHRRELFAVASVGLALKHDRVFKEHFFRGVMGVSSAELKHDFHLGLQMAHCSDLQIRDFTSGKLHVVEFKIAAPLGPHQNPGNTQFLKNGSGYGRQIKKLARQQNLRAGNYTVVNENREFEDGESDGVSVRARTWASLAPPQESLLVKDLLDSIANFGIPSLQFRNMPRMKNATHAIHAFNMYATLQNLLDDFRRVPMDIGSNPEYRWCGIPIRPRREQHKSLRNLLGHKWPDIGWIGYLLPLPMGEPELSVWLYFAGPNARQDVQNRLKRSLPSVDVRLSNEGGTDLIVAQAAHKIRDENQWFKHVLSKVLATADATRRRNGHRGA